MIQEKDRPLPGRGAPPRLPVPGRGTVPSAHRVASARGGSECQSPHRPPCGTAPHAQTLLSKTTLEIFEKCGFKPCNEESANLGQAATNLLRRSFWLHYASC